MRGLGVRKGVNFDLGVSELLNIENPSPGLAKGFPSF
jgi:hypothetical protein